MAGGTLFCDPPGEAVTRAPELGPTRRRQDLVLSVLFLALLAAPVAALLLGLDTSPRGGEKPKAFALPALTASRASVLSFGARLRTSFEDSFGFRGTLIRAHALLHTQVFRASPSPTVLWGRDGWLFYAGDGGLDDFISERPFTEDELVRWSTVLVANRDWLRARGIAYVFTLAPDKHVVYPEFIPPTVRRMNRHSRLDQLAAHLRAHTDLVTVDLQAALLEAKATERVFDLTDTHWNPRGAFVGYEAIMNAVAARVPGVPPPLPRSAFTATSTRESGQDLAVMLGLSDVFSEEYLSLAPRSPRQARIVEPDAPDRNGDDPFFATEVPGSSLPRALVFRDSFASRLYPFLSEHFSRTAYVWQHDMDPAFVLKEHPAVVIHEIVGRHLTTLVPYAYEAVHSKTGEP